jgi:hypothetical protein
VSKLKEELSAAEEPQMKAWNVAADPALMKRINVLKAKLSASSSELLAMFVERMEQEAQEKSE